MTNNGKIEVRLPGKAEDVIAVLKAHGRQSTIYLYEEGCSTPLGDAYLQRRNGSVVVCGKPSVVKEYFHQYFRMANLDAEESAETSKTELELTASRQ